MSEGGQIPVPAPARAEWAAERSVAPAEVAGWLAGCGYAAADVRPLAEGFDNLIFEADGLYVRAARRRIARDDIIKETALLPRLAGLGGLAVPRVAVVPADVADLEWPWFAYEPVIGEELTGALLRPTELRPAAAALGRFLRALHDPALADELRGSVREDTIRRTDIPYRCGRALERIAALEEAGHDIHGAALRRIVAAAGSIPVLPNVALVHGDLHFRHLLLGGEDQPTGIIDWGDAHIGHPAVDLHGYWAFFDPAERAELAAAYGPIDEMTLRAARLIAVYISAVLVLSAADFGLPNVRMAGLEALRRTLVD